MIGILYAFISAFLKGIQAIYNKKNAVDSGVYITSWAVRFVPIIIVLPVIIFRIYGNGIPQVNTQFYLALLISGFINVVATVIKIKAFEISDVSLITPITAVSPGLTAIAAFFILNEVVPPVGIVGLIFIIIGVYMLNLSPDIGKLEPILSVMKNRGVQLIFFVMLLYSVSSSYDKLGVLSSSPILWVLSVHLFASVFLTFIMVKVEDDWLSIIYENKKNLIIMGLLSGFSIIFQMLSLEIILVSYTISIKRMSVLVSVFLSWAILGEKTNIKLRAIGSIVILAGATIITFTI